MRELRVVVSQYDSWDFDWAVPAGEVVAKWGFAPERDNELCKRYEDVVVLTLVPCPNHGEGCECSYRNVEEEAPREEGLVERCADCNCPVPAGDFACEECRPLAVAA